MAAESDLGDFVLRASATQIEGVVVKARIVRREADRFVVDVADAPAAAGRDGAEPARTRSRRMDGRRENLDQRQRRHEGVRERPRAAHGTRAPHGLPPIAAPRKSSGSRSSPRPARTTTPMRRAASSSSRSANGARTACRARLAAHGTERTDTSLRPRGQRLDPQRTARPQCLGLGTPRLIGNGQPGGDLLHRRAETAERRIVDERRRLQRRRDTGGRLRVRRKKQPRSRILVPAPQHADDDRNLDGHDVRKRDEHREPLCGRERRKRLRGTFNYVRKIDTLGSTFKVLGDYAHRNTSLRNDNRSRIAPLAPAPAVDSLYRDRTRSSLRRGGADARTRQAFLGALETQDRDQIHA